MLFGPILVHLFLSMPFSSCELTVPRIHHPILMPDHPPVCCRLSHPDSCPCVPHSLSVLIRPPFHEPIRTNRPWSVCVYPSICSCLRLLVRPSVPRTCICHPMHQLELNSGLTWSEPPCRLLLTLRFVHPPMRTLRQLILCPSLGASVHKP